MHSSIEYCLHIIVHVHTQLYMYLLYQPYDSLCCEEVTLSNVGKVALDFEVLGAVDGNQLEPGQFSVSPAQVSIICNY